MNKISVVEILLLLIWIVNLHIEVPLNNLDSEPENAVSYSFQDSKKGGNSSNG